MNNHNTSTIDTKDSTYKIIDGAATSSVRETKATLDTALCCFLCEGCGVELSQDNARHVELPRQIRDMLHLFGGPNCHRETTTIPRDRQCMPITWISHSANANTPAGLCSSASTLTPPLNFDSSISTEGVTMLSAATTCTNGWPLTSHIGRRCR